MAAKRLLLVEGDEDKRVIPQLIERATKIPWEDARKQRLVEIKSADGVEKLLAAGYIQTELKSAGLRSLGVIVDADLDSFSRWNSLRDRCLQFCPDFPERPMSGGFLTELPTEKIPGQIRFGAWLMPDNADCGMLETFLLSLCPDGPASPLWAHLDQAVTESRQHGAAWKDCHKDKVRCHTYLAWQDPPGRQLHQAIMEKQLDASNASGQSFVKWFRDLYQI